MPETAPDAAVLLMAHGTPESVDQIPDYLRLVRGGREQQMSFPQSDAREAEIQPRFKPRFFKLRYLIGHQLARFHGPARNGKNRLGTQRLKESAVDF